ncbi:MAG: hypothetical protein NC177_13695 [Ruminococcus flavefaciens]|nr:hypothetical protein [Ruminococcus flavefaciens]
MKRRMLLINNCSVVFFFISSCSLLGVPLINLDDELPKMAYIIALLFWLGLIIGISMQIAAWSMCREIKHQRKKTHRERKLLIPFTVFLILFFVIFLFWNKSVVLISVDLALTLFSIEFYFYFKRRYSV